MADDAARFHTISEHLFTAVIGDILDVGGLHHQFLPPAVRAFRPAMIVGRAMTVQEADCCGDEVVAEGGPRAFGLMFRALDSLMPGEVYVAAGGTPLYARWGGLMSRRAHGLGAVGAVLDGPHRDSREIEALGFPVFSHGAYAQDQRVRGRVIDFRCPIEFPNGVRVRQGDVVVGDIDGVVIIPAEHLDDVVADAMAKVHGESTVRSRIAAGDATQAIFDQTGIM
jgi:4-hydroxy-4-methyl-2-oxoglutarate aldolase